jgi:hypothetical protein
MDTYAKAVSMLKQAITDAINKAIEKEELPQAEIPQFIIETPADRSHGDFATNVAMACARNFRTAPVKIAQAIKENIDATVLIVAQRVGTIMDADRIVVLDEGRIVGMGKHSELIESCDVYREIYNSQMTEEVTA